MNFHGHLSGSFWTLPFVDTAWRSSMHWLRERGELGSSPLQAGPLTSLVSLGTKLTQQPWRLLKPLLFDGVLCKGSILPVPFPCLEDAQLAFLQGHRENHWLIWNWTWVSWLHSAKPPQEDTFHLRWSIKDKNQLKLSQWVPIWWFHSWKSKTKCREAVLHFHPCCLPQRDPWSFRKVMSLLPWSRGWGLAFSRLWGNYEEPIPTPVHPPGLFGSFVVPLWTLYLSCLLLSAYSSWRQGPELRVNIDSYWSIQDLGFISLLSSRKSRE